MEVKIEQSWKQALQSEFNKPYFAELVRFLHQEKGSGQVIFPPGSQIFRAFDLTPVSQVKVVILGQDPYHGPGQAMGLSFSVPDGVPAPPSLKNIFKEIETDLGITMSGRPNLENWARQGVLLLNAVLTVRSGQAASHSGIGWQEFTDAVIRYISDNCEGVVFLLWGNSHGRSVSLSIRRAISSWRRRIPHRLPGAPSSAAAISHVQTPCSFSRARLLSIGNYEKDSFFSGILRSLHCRSFEYSQTCADHVRRGGHSRRYQSGQTRFL